MQHAFNLDEAVEFLARTPAILQAILGGGPEQWSATKTNADSWSPREVLEHLIHGEHTDWIPRTRHILAENPAPFEPFDRTGGHSTEGAHPDIAALLSTFADLRRANLATLAGFNLTPADFQRPGLHPELGAVNLGQLLATWVVHDLDHLVQIMQSLAQPYATAIGPWRAYLPIVQTKE